MESVLESGNFSGNFVVSISNANTTGSLRGKYRKTLLVHIHTYETALQNPLIIHKEKTKEIDV